MGELGGARSLVRAYSPLIAADVSGEAARQLVVPLDPSFEHALLLSRGAGRLDEMRLASDTLYYLGCGRRELVIGCDADPVRLLLLGGAPFGETILMWWNFVARTSEEIVAAREDWETGRRFGEVRAYHGPRLDAPPFAASCPATLSRAEAMAVWFPGLTLWLTTTLEMLFVIALASLSLRGHDRAQH